METQLRFVSKQEAHRLIDAMPGDGVTILTFNKKIGMSDHGTYLKKKVGKRLVNDASTLILSENNTPLSVLSLHKTFFSDIENSNNVESNAENIIRSILLSRTQQEHMF